MTNQTEKAQRLMVLLGKIEEEMANIGATLLKLEKLLPTDDPKLTEVKAKVARLEELTLKVKKARLNLNFFFI